MPYVFELPKSPAFTITGLEGYSFGPLRQTHFDVFIVESVKGHDTFMVSKRITRTYYVLSGSGYFTIDNDRYNVSPGMLVEVPPKVEYTYSGRMTLLGIASGRWSPDNETHTRWNPDSTCRRDPNSLPGRESRLTRLSRVRIAGKSPVGAFLKFNKWLWKRLPSRIERLPITRRYGNCVHAIARVQNPRCHYFSTHFLRNRPQLELIRRLLDKKSNGETLKVAVLGCSLGAEVYSLAWTIKNARPDLNLILDAADISPHAVEFARCGAYSLTSSGSTSPAIFERMTAEEKENFFDTDGQFATVKPWIKEGIRWHVGDVGEPEIVEELGLSDIVVASNFLCHMIPAEAERCLRNIAGLVSSGGSLFVAGIDLDVRTKVALDLGWHPMEELLEDIHAGDPVMAAHWPWQYGGLEPLDKSRRDWKVRYAAAFEVPNVAVAPVEYERELANQ
jgi:SAM-dependent methyltransferase